MSGGSTRLRMRCSTPCTRRSGCGWKDRNGSLEGPGESGIRRQSTCPGQRGWTLSPGDSWGERRRKTDRLMVPAGRSYRAALGVDVSFGPGLMRTVGRCGLAMTGGTGSDVRHPRVLTLSRTSASPLRPGALRSAWQWQPPPTLSPSSLRT